MKTSQFLFYDTANHGIQQQREREKNSGENAREKPTFMARIKRCSNHVSKVILEYWLIERGESIEWEKRQKSKRFNTLDWIQ